MAYSFISQEKFDQITEQHLNSISKSDRSVITNELAEQIIRLIENNFKDNFADRNLIRWSQQFTIRTINGTKFLHKKVSRNHQQVELRVCTREEMCHIFCHMHNGDSGEVIAVKAQHDAPSASNYCLFPQAISHAACKGCSVCCSSESIQKHPEGKPIIAKRFLQRLQVIIFISTIVIIQYLLILLLNCR